MDYKTFRCLLRVAHCYGVRTLGELAKHYDFCLLVAQSIPTKESKPDGQQNQTIV